VRINVAIPESHVEAPVLDAALESVTRLNESMLERGQVPPFDRALDAGVRWKPEPPGQEYFDHAGTVIQRKWGDCDDLAPYHAATLRHKGIDPEATAIVKRSGPNRWHAVVQRSDGTIDDPSRDAGMGSKVHGIVGAVVPQIGDIASQVSGAYIVKPAIAMKPMRGGWAARADVPWTWKEHLDDKPSPTDYAMATLHASPLASTALTGAIDGALEMALCGGYADPDHLNRLACLAEACEGVERDELARVYGEAHADAAVHLVGSFFGKAIKRAGKLAKGAVRTAMKVAPGVVQFVPGIGPVASSALNTTMKALSKTPGASAPLPVAAMSQFPSVDEAHEMFR
jgi:hypothetical protein